MNGKELLEAMSFVDEQYIDEAEAVARRFRWQPIAAMAACLALVLFGYRYWSPTQKQAAMSTAPKEIMSQAAAPLPTEEAAMDVTAEAAPMLRSAVSEMTVRFDRYEDGEAVYIVIDSGTGSYPKGAEIRITLPEGEMQESEEQYLVYFLPEEADADTVQAVDMIPAETGEP